MLIKNVRYFNSGQFQRGDLRVKAGRFTALRPACSLELLPGEELIEGENLLLLPGLCDIHMHGALGEDFSDANLEGLQKLQAYEAKSGILKFCPTSMTLAADRLQEIFRVGAEAQQSVGATLAHIVGFHMEGPYLSQARLGAQNPAFLNLPSLEAFLALQELAQGGIRIVSLAPEITGAKQFIARFSSELIISLAHTEVNYEGAKAAFALGARQLTHMFNAMPGLHHRAPGPIAAASEEPGVSVEIIADGIHVHPAMLRLAFKLFPGRVILVSDSMRATGLTNGTYDLGGQAVSVKGREARLPNGALAGSVSNLATCLRCAVEFGIPLAEAVYAASEYPCSCLGLDPQTYMIAESCEANFILAGADLNFKKVYLGGKAI